MCSRLWQAVKSDFVQIQRKFTTKADRSASCIIRAYGCYGIRSVAYYRWIFFRITYTKTIGQSCTSNGNSIALHIIIRIHFHARHVRYVQLHFYSFATWNYYYSASILSRYRFRPTRRPAPVPAESILCGQMCTRNYVAKV